MAPDDTIIKYEGGKRVVLAWEELKVPKTRPGVAFKDKGVYLITGGMGGLGILFVREILKQSKRATIILSGRSELSLKRQLILEELQTLGGSVTYQRVDVSKLEQVNSLIETILNKYGKLDGIIHGAGVISDNFILKKTLEEFRSVLDPKVSGSINLDKATQGIDLDFFVMFSSVAGVMGNIGQADYATANAFMDRFAAYRNRLVTRKERNGHTISINWPLWKDGGMGVHIASEEMMKQFPGMVAMHAETGILSFYQSLDSRQSQVVVLVGNMMKMRAVLFEPVLIEEAHLEEESAISAVDPEILEEKTVLFLKRELASVLKLPSHKIDIQVPLEKYGIDSILAMNLTNQLEKTFGSLSKTLFFEYQTIGELIHYFVESYGSKLASIFQEESNALEATSPKDISVIQSTSKIRQKSRKRFGVIQASGIHDTFSGPLEIAIVGLSGRYPESVNLREYWKNLRDGKDCIVEVPGNRWNWREYFSEDRGKGGSHYSKWGGFIEGVDEFDPLFFNISPREAKVMDPQERLFLEHSWMAMEDAGYTRESLQKDQCIDQSGQVGVYVGVMYGEYQLLGVEESMRGDRMGFAGILGSIANRISYVFNLHGPSMTVDTMCSSSLTSIHLACQDLKHGRTNLAIAGGVNVSIHPNKYLMLSAGQFISTKGHCESFGEGGDGYIPGEGVGVVILKRLDEAIRDSDNIYGIIQGSAINHGGKTNGYTVPNPKAQRGVVERAVLESGVDPRHISYIEAHGTGTKLGDPIEIAALSQAFEKHTEEKGFCRIGSAKSNIGHCEGAAGIGGLTKVLLQMKYGQIAPSLHSSTLNPNIDFKNTPFVVNQELRNWDCPVINGQELPRIAGISSFGAGGSNAHLIVKEYQDLQRESAIHDSVSRIPVIVPLSARTKEQLLESARNILQFLKEHAFVQNSESPTYMDSRQLVQSIQMNLSQQLKIDAVEFGTAQEFQEYGVEQAHQIALLKSLQEEYSTVLDPRAFMENNSIESLVAWLIENESSIVMGQSNQNHPTDTSSLDLIDFSYTLQTGREAMDKRLGFIVTSTKELEIKLEAYVLGNQEIEECYQGQVKRNKDTISIFAASEELQETIQKWIQRRKLSNILDLWVKGLVFDWNKLYGETKPKRISLPTYPFARERYWILDTQGRGFIATSGSSVSVIHPLLHENTSDLTEQSFASTFTGKEFFLNDHQVKGEKILPGVGYLEMARAAVEKASGETEGGAVICLANVLWAQQIVVNDFPRTVHIGLQGEDNGQIQYEVYTESDNEEGAIVHSQGIAEFKGKEKAPILDIQNLRSQMNQGTLSTENCYRAFKEMGIEYGEGHRGILEIYQGENHVLAKLRLPSSVQDTQNDYVLHPSLMDAALQSSIGLIRNNEVLPDSSEAPLKPSLPFALESLEILCSCTFEMYAWVHYSGDSVTTDNVQKLDIDLCDEQGNICVKMRRFTFRILGGEIGVPKVKESIGTLLATPVWKEKDVLSSATKQVYAGRQVLVCEISGINARELQFLIPGSHCENLKSEELQIGSRFFEYAVRCFEIIREVLEKKPQG
ncbi:MAG: SDR family NAD(P)-dependent oxidoreductase, partial [Gammaproteobacteria bacterium]|nr:SDR family NAD(P)-dependent oxidoreductase [Gammaproteobacteria bacterium]